MRYWKGLAIAAVFDLVWIMGCPFTPTEPDPPPFQAVAWTAASSSEPQVLDELTHVGRLEDSLMVHLQESPDDVDAMLLLANVYTAQGWDDSAIGPLARALELDPSRRSLWVALDRAVAKTGRAKITDAELVRRAIAFVETVKMWGMGC
jgi:cytochrome c-type biogenesis protein CcmH/NrfG